MKESLLNAISCWDCCALRPPVMEPREGAQVVTALSAVLRRGRVRQTAGGDALG